MSALTTVASYGRKGSSARVRIHDWLDFLGLEAEHYTYTNEGNNSISTLARHLDRALAAEVSLRRLARRGTAGTLLMSREASPLSNGRLEARILRGAQRSVYDFDDAIFHNAAPFPYNLWPKDKVWVRSVRAAGHVIAGNDYLAQEAVKYNSDVTVIPSCVNPRDYVRKTDYSLAEVPTLVWLGSPATEQFLGPLAEALLRVNRVTPIRLRVISGGSQSLGPLDELVERVQWTEESFGKILKDADLGIMPLADNEFTRGKCAYKLLQYGAAALPVLGSPVGTNKDVLAKMGGLSASTSDEWETAVLDFLRSTEQDRAAQGAQGLKTIESDYSFAAWRGEWTRLVGA